MGQASCRPSNILRWALDATDFRPSRSGGATVPVAKLRPAARVAPCSRAMTHRGRRFADFRDSVRCLRTRTSRTTARRAARGRAACAARGARRARRLGRRRRRRTSRALRGPPPARAQGFAQARPSPTQAPRSLCTRCMHSRMQLSSLHLLMGTQSVRDSEGLFPWTVWEAYP
jgi:hypothetical protein